MRLDPRLPVIVGVAQSVRRPSPARVATGAPEPLAMIADVVEAAAADSGAGRKIVDRIESVRVVDVLSWRYMDAPGLLASRLGITPRETVRVATGGNGPQLAVNDAATAIARGDLDVAVVAGAEAMYTRLLVRKTRERLDWTPPDASSQPGAVLGDDRPGTNEQEMQRSLALPTQVYPLIEQAVRVASGDTIDAHQARLAALWARFSAVVSTNPYAWSPERRTADEIATVSAENRMIGFPYTKLMNANIQVDQAAAVLVCSVAAAESLGVPRDRWAFVRAAADAHDHWWLSERDDLASSPAIRLCGRDVFGAVGAGRDDVAHVDLYSCFPSAVQIAARELGFPSDDPARPLTVTGGLSFAGGPGNNYASHSIATMVARLRESPAGTLGLVTALGWYVTKHAMALYSSSPPLEGRGFVRSSPQAEVDALPRRDPAPDYEGPVRVEAWTVMHERDGSPALGIVACLTPGGARVWGNVRDDAALLTAMTREELAGRETVLRADGSLAL